MSITTILGIETSCDETAASVIKAGKGKLKVLSNIVSSQTKIHARWGGVVPNLAAREHLKNIILVINLAFKEAGIKPHDIDLITVTRGPGLIPALLIGTNVAKTLAYVWKKPLLGIHHIEGHIYANFISVNSKSNKAKKLRSSDIKFPILCLVVSGGHTQLILMKKHLDYEIIGETLDDAAGEAFDKVARILGLGYPGGPAIAKFASQWKSQVINPKSETNSKFKIQNSKFFRLPRPMINSNNLNFSFSGLKTAVLYETKKLKTINYKLKAILCAEFQQAVVDVLISKTLKAAKIYCPKTIMLAGGVSANIELRNQLRNNLRRYYPNTIYKIPDIRYSIDNAAMIAAAGYYRWKYMTVTQKKKALSSWKTLQPDANLKLK
ncbi:MAG: tRNA (adenosine(37)-N6)-threonylcarbamoyltransferase complex transferase subunit TsaD [Candidatus Moranbacteria bacterium]|nr:tRNA (adenosine(37)-N6)-threonylcarbamoyltransferase complex transferase subunit TsaD [Candidatus Moranbacteria bacterium]